MTLKNKKSKKNKDFKRINEKLKNILLKVWNPELELFLLIGNQMLEILFFKREISVKKAFMRKKWTRTVRKLIMRKKWT